MWIFRTKFYNSKLPPSPQPVFAGDHKEADCGVRNWPSAALVSGPAPCRGCDQAPGRTGPMPHSSLRRHRASDERRPPGVRRIMMFLLRSVGDKNDKIKVWGFVGEESNVLCDGSLNIEIKPDLFPFLSFRLFLFLCFTFFLSFPPVILAQKSPS